MEAARNFISSGDRAITADVIPWDVPQSPQPQAFWGRCIRALAMVLLSAAAHQWLLPGARSPLPPMPGPALASFPAPLPQRAEPTPPSVQVVTELVMAGAEPSAVGTSGLTASPRRELQSATTNDASGGTPAAPDEPQPDRPAIPAAPAPEPRAEPSIEEVEPPLAPALIQQAPRLATAAMDGSAAPVMARPAVVRSNVDPQQRVRQLIAQYAAAFERLDVAAAKAVWPTLNEKALRRAFDQLEAQQVTFQSCGITIEGAGAQARCQGEATYRPRIGSRTLHLSAREWTFDIAQAGDGWHIVDARVR